MKEKAVALVSVVLLFACQGTQVEENKKVPREPIDAEARFAELEHSLLESKNLSMTPSLN